MAPACLRGRHGCKTRLNRERVPLGWGRVPGPQASCDCVEYADCRGIGLDRVFAQDDHGDWWSIKDIARLRIVLNDQAQCMMVAREVADEYTQKRFVWNQEPRPQRVIQSKVVKAENPDRLLRVDRVRADG